MPEASPEANSPPQWPPVPAALDRGPPPNMVDYERARCEFSWPHLGDPVGGRINMAQVALDRPAAATPEKLAVRFFGAGFTHTDFTFLQLQRRANQFANLLTAHGIERGSVVCSLLGRCPELLITLFGALKYGAVFSPLFSAFGPEPIRARLELAQASVLVTSAALYQRKVAALRSALPTLRLILLIDDDNVTPCTGVWSLARELDRCSDQFATSSLAPDTPALLHFTSGTTGKPKGVVHVHRAVIAHEATARLALDLHPEDVFWCTADPGWVTGISYGAIAPLACGVTSIVDCEELDVERWFALLAREHVSVWYTAPTAIRMLMKAGIDAVRRHRYPALRHIASVGEPLNPEAVMWGVEAFGLPVHDTWWQTETGAIMIANFRADPVWPGAMGRAMPGVDIAIARRLPTGAVELLADDEIGEIVLRPGWPSMFVAYLNDPARYEQCFADGWYFSGDQARRDARGNFWFIGRSDDVIKSAGHLISPFEVESALNLHPAVMQSAVIGLPNDVMGQVVKGIVELKPGYQGSIELQRDILAHGRRMLGAAIAPREIGFVATLPRTRSGKIMRRLLRARELKLPEGDLSTLETPA